MFRLFTCALLISGGIAFTVQAADPVLSKEGFNRLLARLREHPEIASYASKAEATEHYAKGELGLPDPMLNVQRKDFPIGSSTSQDFEQKMIGFKQEIPAFGTRGAKFEGKQAEARKTRLTADYAYATMKAKLIATLASLQRIREQEKLLDEQARLFASERKSIKGRIAANQSGVSQLSMSQSEATEIDIMRSELAEQEHEMQAMLANMVGDEPEAALPPIVMAAWDGKPDQTYPVKIAAEDITVARKEVDMREAEFGPRFEISADVGRMNNNDNAGSIMVGVSIPLWSGESQKPKLAGAQAALHSSELDNDAAKRDVTQKLHHLRAQIETSGKKIELLKTKHTQLGQAANAISREYEAGKADFAMYLKARREALSAAFTQAEEQARHTALIADFNSYIIQGGNQ